MSRLGKAAPAAVGSLSFCAKPCKAAELSADNSSIDDVIVMNGGWFLQRVVVIIILEESAINTYVGIDT